MGCSIVKKPDLKKWKQKVLNKVTVLINTEALKLKNTAQANAPVKTGALQRSHAVSKQADYRASRTQHAEIVATVPYASIVYSRNDWVRPAILQARKNILRGRLL